MKTVKYFIAAIVMIAFGITASAQTSKTQSTLKTETFKVWGNCDMCKDRIETAMTEAGVSKANWDVKTKMLTVTFDPSKTNVDALDKKLASVGHDTEKYKADDNAYNGLPACCKYKRDK